MKGVQTVLEHDRKVICLHQYFSFAHINHASSFRTLQTPSNCICHQFMHASKAKGKTYCRGKKSKRITSLEFIRTNSGEWNISLHSIPQSMDNLGKHLSLKRLKNLKQTSNDPQQLCSILQIFLLNSSRFCNRTVTKTSMFFCLKICP